MNIKEEVIFTFNTIRYLFGRSYNGKSGAGTNLDSKVFKSQDIFVLDGYKDNNIIGFEKEDLNNTHKDIP